MFNYFTERVLRTHAVETKGQSVTLPLLHSGAITIRELGHTAPAPVRFLNGQTLNTGDKVWITRFCVKLLDVHIHTLFTTLAGYRKLLFMA